MKAAPCLIAALAAASLLAACDGGQREAAPMRQTRLPGMVTAGGGTSGEVIARAGGVRQPAPAGTPGIPQGAEGNTSGTQMGGTAVATAAAQPASSAAPAAGAAERAQQEQAALEAAMDRVAAHWRRRAGEQGWQLAAPPPHAAAAALPRSEKLGTAEPSEDAKQSAKPPPDPGVGADAPDALPPPAER